MIQHFHRSFFNYSPLWFASLLLVACGGGNSGGTEGGGQAPDPVTVDLPIAYIERPLPADEDNPALLLPFDILDPAAFNPGAAIYLKPRATALAAAENITLSAWVDNENFTPDTPNYDVKDLTIHPSGDRLLFAMRAPEIPNVDEEDQPKWGIWEYHLTTKILRRIITSTIVAAAGHDLSPRYLPDDRIVFSSTRQIRSRALLLDDNKPQYTAQEEGNDGPAFVLHVMDGDGTNIQQITYNQSHDLHPTVLENGRVLFIRWDQADGRNNLSLYTVNPDGADLQYHYGFNSLNTNPRDESLMLFRPQQMPSRQIAAILKRRGEFLGGDMVMIDTENFVEQDVAINGGGGEAQQRLYHLDIVTDDERSRNGLFSSLHPLFDGTNRLLISWSQCRMQVMATSRLVPCTDEWWENAEAEIAPPLYGIWIYNITDSTQQPVVLGKEGRMFTEAVTLEPQLPPTYIAPTTDSSAFGTLHIRSVYDADLAGVGDNLNLSAIANPAQTSAAERPARFIRILKAVSIADNDVLDEQDDTAYGNRFNQNTNLREIIGYAPVEPDGSVLVQIPADIAFTIDVLDGEGQRISNNTTYWMQLRPGERRECNACLATTVTQPVSRADAAFVSVNPGAAGGVSFAGTARFDQFGTPELPTAGETMAEFAARTSFAAPGAQAGDPDIYLAGEVREPSVDLIFVDQWTDPALAPRDEPFAYRYLDLIPGDQEQSAAKAPLKNKGCLEDWNSTCRIVINYENHIQYIWERERLVDIDPDPAIEVAADATCTGCHNRIDASVEPAVQRIPASQLELTAEARANDRMRSYVELLNNDVELELVEGSLTPRLIETGECNVDENGEEIRDEQGVCTDPILTTVGVRASMSTGGARASNRFFARFNNFNAVTDTVDHRGYLNPSELKLLKEWLDLRARYYQNPFDSADPIQD